MKKTNIIYAMGLFLLTMAITSCTKTATNTNNNNTGGGNTTTAKWDTVITQIKPDASNFLLATVGGAAVANVDSLYIERIDSAGVTVGLYTQITYAAKASGPATQTFGIIFGKPGSIGATTTISAGSFAVVYVPDFTIQPEDYYLASFGTSGTAGTMTITSNDAIGRKIAGTFDNVTAIDQQGQSQGATMPITGGSFSINY